MPIAWRSVFLDFISMSEDFGFVLFGNDSKQFKLAMNQKADVPKFGVFNYLYCKSLGTILNINLVLASKKKKKKKIIIGEFFTFCKIKARLVEEFE